MAWLLSLLRYGDRSRYLWFNSHGADPRRWTFEKRTAAAAATFCDNFSTKKEMIKNLVDISSTKADNEGGRGKTFTTFTFVKVSGRRSSADPGFH